METPWAHCQSNMTTNIDIEVGYLNINICQFVLDFQLNCNTRILGWFPQQATYSKSIKNYIAATLIALSHNTFLLVFYGMGNRLKRISARNTVWLNTWNCIVSSVILKGLYMIEPLPLFHRQVDVTQYIEDQPRVSNSTTSLGCDIPAW